MKSFITWQHHSWQTMSKKKKSHILNQLHQFNLLLYFFKSKFCPTLPLSKFSSHVNTMHKNNLIHQRFISFLCILDHSASLCVHHMSIFSTSLMVQHLSYYDMQHIHMNYFWFHACITPDFSNRMQHFIYTAT